MGGPVRVIAYALAGLWLFCLALLILVWAYGAVLGWLTRRAWEPVEALAREIEAEEAGLDPAAEAYLAWLERTWRHPAGRVPRVVPPPPDDPLPNRYQDS